MLKKSTKVKLVPLLLTTATLVASCSKPASESNSAFGDAAIPIVQDLNLQEGITIVLVMTETDLERPEMGTRDEALILTEYNGAFTLRYVFRFPQSGNANFRRWDLWVNHELIGDGTGAEIPAIKEYSYRPSPEQIAAFRTEVLNHWSNQ